MSKLPQLITTKNCPKCKLIKEYMAQKDFTYEVIEAEKNMKLCRNLGIMIAPTMLVHQEDRIEQFIGFESIQKYIDKQYKKRNKTENNTEQLGKYYFH